MRIRPILPFILSLMFSTPVMAAADAPLPGLQPVSPASSSPGEGAVDARQAERAKLVEEMQQLKERLPAMEQELQQLHRKWKLAKGRAPTRKELEEFEKKRAKGPVSDKDNPYIRRTPTSEEVEEFEKKRAKGPVNDKNNPYINKGPFGSPGLSREAYYKKLNDLEMLNQRIADLRKGIEKLGP